jgi:hypothetical protein
MGGEKKRKGTEEKGGWKFRCKKSVELLSKVDNRKKKREGDEAVRERKPINQLVAVSCVDWSDPVNVSLMCLWLLETWARRLSHPSLHILAPRSISPPPPALSCALSLFLSLSLSPRTYTHECGSQDGQLSTAVTAALCAGSRSTQCLSLLQGRPASLSRRLVPYVWAHRVVLQRMCRGRGIVSGLWPTHGDADTRARLCGGTFAYHPRSMPPVSRQDDIWRVSRSRTRYLRAALYPRVWYCRSTCRRTYPQDSLPQAPSALPPHDSQHPRHHLRLSRRSIAAGSSHHSSVLVESNHLLRGKTRTRSQALLVFPL